MHSYHLCCTSKSTAVYVTQNTDFFLSCFLTPWRNCVPHWGQVPLPFLGEPHLAELLEVSLHGPVHGEEVALQEPAECGGSHLPHLGTGGNEHNLFIRAITALLKHTQLTQVGKSCSTKAFKVYPAISSFLDGSLKLKNMLCCNTELLSQKLP